MKRGPGMSPEIFAAYLRVAREGRVGAFEVSPDGTLRVSMAPAELVPRRPGAREAEDRLAEVDEGLLYGSAGGA